MRIGEHEYHNTTSNTKVDGALREAGEAAVRIIGYLTTIIVDVGVRYGTY